jgi:hypothetical protein
LTRWLTILVLGAAAGALLYLLVLRRGPATHSSIGIGVTSDAVPVAPQPDASAAPAASPAVGSPGNAPAVPVATPATFPTSALPPATPFVLGSAEKPPAMEPAVVLNNMRIAIHQYGSRFGGNPVGTNPEITKALNGENPKEVRFLAEDSGLRINARGELVDYWGTPFFFHQLSASVMEIHSAGPDRVMWTADDLVTK